jgi:uncharacterized protein involved in outer membrane biogenesis
MEERKLMRWKWIVGIGVLVIVILIAAAYVYLNTYDYNKLKPLVARMVEDATGRKLSLDGEVSFQFGFAPALVVTKVALANVSWGSQPQMIEIEKLQAKVRLLPLLFKDLDVKYIRLVGVKVLLETGPRAQGNWGFLAGSNSTGSIGAFKPTALEVNQVHIENLDLTFRGTGTGPPRQFTLSSLVMNRQENEDALTLKLKADYNEQALALSGKIGRIRDVFAHQRFPLQLSGKLANAAVKINGEIDDVLTLQGIDVEAQLSGKNFATLEPVLDIQLPKTKAFDVSGHLKGSGDSLGLDNINGNLSGSSVDIAISGRVDNLIAFSGVDLKLKSSGKDLAVMGPVIGEKLPATDEFEIQGHLTGSSKALTMKNAQASAKSGDLRFTVNGAVKDLLTLRGMDLQSRLTGKDLAEFGVVIGEKLPVTDQFEIQGRLTGSTEALTLQEAKGSARRGSMRLSLTGAVKDLLTLRGMNLQSRLTGKNLEAFGEVIGEKLFATDRFEIQGLLTGSTETLTLQKAKGSARRGSMRLSLTGTVKDLLTLGGMDLKSRLTGKELAEIGPMFGTKLPKLGPFDLSGKLSGSAKAISLNKVSAKVDKSDFAGLAKFEFLKRPKITIHLESSVIDFTALMKSLEQDEQKTADKKPQKRRLFSDDPLPFDVLKKMDADILLKARNIHAKDARLEFGHLTLKLEDGDFSIDKFEATYKQTKISGKLHINHSPTRAAANFLVQNFDLGSLLKETGVSDQVRATVDIAAHGKSRGDSVNSLMANLDGSIGAVMGPGYLTKYLDMLSAGLAKKVFSFWRPPKGVDQIKCAVIQFDIKEGVATSQAFVFDTRAGIIDGEGEINLGTEQINFLLVPKPEHPDLSLTTKLRVSGTVMDPKVSPDELALLTKGAEFLSSLAVGPLALLAPFVHLGAHKKHPCDIRSIGQLGLQRPASK